MIRSLKATLSLLLTLTIMLVDLGQEGKEEQLLNASGLDVILHKVLLLFSIDYSKFVHSEMDQNTNIMIAKKV